MLRILGIDCGKVELLVNVKYALDDTNKIESY